MRRDKGAGHDPAYERAPPFCARAGGLLCLLVMTAFVVLGS